MQKSIIKLKADRLRKKFNLNTPPIDVEKICENMNITISRMDMSQIEQKLNQDISGAIIVEKNNAEIKINKNHVPGRQNFTIAHELGHKILHIEDDDDGVIVSFRSLKNRREREADIFAAELLMPDDLVIKEYNDMFFPLVCQLAEIFNVSKSAMKVKLDELGLTYIG